jgi:hypothetical protein
LDDPEASVGNASNPRRPEERLDSWKKIASYLKRDVSTVQRWERREGMPVHRHVHDKLGSVFAFRSELDAWWQSRQGRLEAQPSGADQPEPPVPEGTAAQRTAAAAHRMRPWAPRCVGW